MNYFAHGRRFVDRPYLMGGTALPDWLNVVDRRTRVREKLARQWIGDEDPAVAALAQGVVRHHRDDAWFHDSARFHELSLQFTRWIRESAPPDDSLRPSFLGHILVEILLDAALIERAPRQLEAYYRAVSNLDAFRIADAVSRMTGRVCDSLAGWIGRFVELRFLWDYLDDATLALRVDQVLRRVGLPPMGDELRKLLPAARAEIAPYVDELITPPVGFDAL